MHGINKICRRLDHLHNSATLTFDIKKLLLLVVNVTLSHSRMDWSPLPTSGGVVKQSVFRERSMC